MTFGRSLLPPSWCQPDWPAWVVQIPLPFQPAFGSSMRPSMPRLWKPIGYGTRIVTNLPFTRA